MIGASGTSEGEAFSVGATIHCAPGRAKQCPVSARDTFATLTQGTINCRPYRGPVELVDAPIIGPYTFVILKPLCAKISNFPIPFVIFSVRMRPPVR